MEKQSITKYHTYNWHFVPIFTNLSLKQSCLLWACIMLRPCSVVVRQDETGDLVRLSILFTSRSTIRQNLKDSQNAMPMGISATANSGNTVDMMIQDTIIRQILLRSISLRRGRTASTENIQLAGYHYKLISCVFVRACLHFCTSMCVSVHACAFPSPPLSLCLSPNKQTT